MATELRHWVIACVVASVLSVAPTAFAQPPTSFPLGDHTHNYQLGSGGGKVSSSGWDPAYNTVDQSDKDTLIAEFVSQGYTTFDVGLPGSDEPGDIPNTWPIDGSVTKAKLDAAITASEPGISIISLTGVTGDVYLVDQNTTCVGDSPDGCPGLTFTDDEVQIAFTRSAFGHIKCSDSSADGVDIWFLDTLLDATDVSGSAVNCYRADRLVFMYSELLGGKDSATGRARDLLVFYKSHVHASTKSSGHADGIQSTAGPDETFIINSNIDYNWRVENGGLWFSTCFGDQGPVYVFDGSFQGGNSSTRVVWKESCAEPPQGGWIDFWVAKDNLYWGLDGNDSWAQAPHQDSGNIDVPEHATGNEELDGVAVTYGVGDVTAGEIAVVDAKIVELEVWVSELRAAAGYEVGEGAPSVGLTGGALSGGASVQ